MMCLENNEKIKSFELFKLIRKGLTLFKTKTEQILMMLHTDSKDYIGKK